MTMSTEMDGPMQLRVCRGFQDEARNPWREVKWGHVTDLSADDFEALASMALEEAGADEPGDIQTGRPIWCAGSELDERLAKAVEAVRCEVAEMGVGGHVGNLVKESMRTARFMCSAGAGFHNDTVGDWKQCIFWVLVLKANDVDFVMPEMALRKRISMGDLFLFDPSLAHGVCRSSAGGRFNPSDFEKMGREDFQTYLSGEVNLDDEAWAALGCEWSEELAIGGTDLAKSDIDPWSGSVTGAAA